MGEQKTNPARIRCHGLASETSEEILTRKDLAELQHRLSMMSVVETRK